ncbi:hypothetical protein ACQ86E_08500 [Bradyrhizobium betae]|uniref:hypothetical protein n=1 Tax=Bradyrhizobium betae TaxID=244734 RepID=UPI003D67DE22
MESIGVIRVPALIERDLLAHSDQRRETGWLQSFDDCSNLGAGQDRDHGNGREDRQKNKKASKPKAANSVGNCRHGSPRDVSEKLPDYQSFSRGTTCEQVGTWRPVSLENRLGRRILWILRFNIQFVGQGSRAYESETAILDLDGKKTGQGTFGRYACDGLANTAVNGIDGSEDAVLEVDIALAHVSRAHGFTEARFGIFDASTMVADFFRGDVLVVARSVLRFVPHLVSVLERAALEFNECDGQALIMPKDLLGPRADVSDFPVVNGFAGFLRPELELRSNFCGVRDCLGTGHRSRAQDYRN